jgi:hypothetical protein
MKDTLFEPGPIQPVGVTLGGAFVFGLATYWLTDALLSSRGKYLIKGVCFQSFKIIVVGLICFIASIILEFAKPEDSGNNFVLLISSFLHESWNQSQWFVVGLICFTIFGAILGGSCWSACLRMSKAWQASLIFGIAGFWDLSNILVRIAWQKPADWYPVTITCLYSQLSWLFVLCAFICLRLDVHLTVPYIFLDRCS